MTIEKRLERLEAILDARGLDWDHPRVTDEPPKEPPKKWRILEPGEVVCSGDRVNAKTNPPSDPPNGSGWRLVYSSVGTSVCKDDHCLYARPVADEPVKEAEHPAEPMPSMESYRPVNNSDIGKTVEVQNSPADPWRECTLLAIDWDRPYGFLCRHSDPVVVRRWWCFSRIKIDEPANEAEPEHPAGPMPDPGEGYRILAKNPPEDLQPGDDWWEHDEQRWRGLFPVDTTAQYSRTWYRRKIEPAKEAQPAKPKRWRILDDKETIQAGEWYNAKVNKPRRWPPHGGWQELGGNDICIGSPAGKFPNLLWCREVTDDAEPPKPPEPEYREPVLPADAGKECEFSDDGNAWTEGELRGYAGCFWQSVFGESKTVNRWYHARIKKDA